MKDNFSLEWLTIFYTSFLIFGSCAKSDLTTNNQQVPVSISIITDELDNRDQNYRSSQKIVGSQTDPWQLLRGNNESISLGGGYFIAAEIIPEKLTHNRADYEYLHTARSSMIKEPIKRFIKFRLVVYDTSGDYVRDKIYTINSHGAVEPDDRESLTLDRGVYSFVAYSYNTTVAPIEDLSSTNIDHILSINTASYPQFMLFRSGAIHIGPSNDNNLNIAFKYMFSPMRVTIDATPTNGYLIGGVGGTRLSSGRAIALISLASGNIVYDGESTSSVLTFSSNQQQVITSNTVWMANNISDASLQIGSLRVGSVTRATPIVLNNIPIQPGVGYHIRLRVVPSDRYEVIDGQEAALIDGRYWMRRNVGVSRTIDPDLPDENGSFQLLFGNYYQWGKQEIRATPLTGAEASESEQWSTPALNGSWYSETDNGGKIVENDPCPAGWRVPTSKEFYDLINQTTQLVTDNKGTNWNASVTNVYTAKVFRSKRDKNVVLTFPTAGAYQPGDRMLIERGSIGFYWTSTEQSDNENSVRMRFTINNDANIGAGRSNRPYAFPVRCTRAVY